MHAIASPNATSSGMKIQPGSETVPTESTLTWDQPKAPPTTSRIQSRNVFANVPFADMVAAAWGATGGGCPGWPGDAVVRGAAQPGSRSSAVAVKRLSLRTGFAIVALLGSAR